MLVTRPDLVRSASSMLLICGSVRDDHIEKSYESSPTKKEVWETPPMSLKLMEEILLGKIRCP
jgi:hypothetical protein